MVRWNPELFPGLHFLPRSHSSARDFPKTFVVGFTSGKVVITGSRNREEIQKTWSLVYNIFKSFQTSEKETMNHVDVVSKKRFKEILGDDTKDILNLDMNF